MSFNIPSSSPALAPACRAAATVRLLVSVRNASEAQAALDGGADWIDLKEPKRGPLGPVDARRAHCIVEEVMQRVEISAAAGELTDWPHGMGRALLEVDGLSVLKLGLSRCRELNWRRRWQEARGAIQAAGRELAAVVYADAEAAQSPDAHDVIDLARETSCRWLLIDTFDKSAGPLPDHLNGASLAETLRRARGAGMMTVIAGKLNAENIAQLPLESIDMIAVRGAACDGDRRGFISAERVAHMRACVSALSR